MPDFYVEIGETMPVEFLMTHVEGARKATENAVVHMMHELTDQVEIKPDRDYRIEVKLWELERTEGE